MMKNFGILLTILCLVVSCGKSNSVENDADSGGSFDPKPIPIDPIPVDPEPIDHKIGEFYQGGIIFWIDATKKHGLIAATHDQGGGKWGTREYSTGATLDGILAGKNNTEKITSTFGPSLDYAASIAASCKDGGYNDWYLPSKTELNLMLKQYKVIGGFNTNYTYCGGNSYAWYWSSTEARIGFAWAQTVVQDSQLPRGNPPTYCAAVVRAIRSF